MKFKYELNSKGYLKQRESYNIEFKNASHYGDLAKYLKTLVGFANNKGGEIIFGINDKPRIPVGLLNEKFEITYIQSLERYCIDLTLSCYMVDNISETYLQLKDDMDTIRAEYKMSDNSYWYKKVWYNNVLKITSEDVRFIEVAK